MESFRYCDVWTVAWWNAIYAIELRFVVRLILVYIILELSALQLELESKCLSLIFHDCWLFLSLEIIAIIKCNIAFTVKCHCNVLFC